MLDIIIKTTIILTLLAMTYQDIKAREVSIGLYVISVGLLGFLHIESVNLIQFFTAIAMNVLMTLLIVFVLSIYSNKVLKTPFKNSFGLGDLFFFLILAIAFPTVTFLVLFSFSLLFSLLLFLLIKKNMKIKTVPLAGFQALFTCFILATNWFYNHTNLYLI